VYQVAYSKAVKKALTDLCNRAARTGLGNSILNAIKIIDKHLRSNPLEFGNPWGELPEAKLTVMVKVVPPLIVIYGVHKERPVVFLKAFLPFPTDAF
jgi:hypothetical protein